MTSEQILKAMMERNALSKNFRDRVARQRVGESGENHQEIDDDMTHFVVTNFMQALDEISYQLAVANEREQHAVDNEEKTRLARRAEIQGLIAALKSMGIAVPASFENALGGPTAPAPADPVSIAIPTEEEVEHVESKRPRCSGH